MPARSPMTYQWQGGALLRATTDPGGLDLPRDLDLSDTAGTAPALAWLAQMWQRQHVRDALDAASPGLCRQVAVLLADHRPPMRQVRRTVVSVASYLLRWQRRSTPFALFAGIAPARIGTTPGVSWGTKHSTFARPDADWLADVIVRLEQHPALRERLHVVINNAGHIRGDRFVVPGLPADGRAHLLAPLEVSVGLTRPVKITLDAARSPLPYGALRSLLANQFPSAAPQPLDELLGGLIAQNVLITNLWPPMTCLDGLEHLCQQLEAAGASTVRSIGPLMDQLFAIRDELADHDGTTSWAVRAPVIRRMQEVSAVAPVPLVVDTVLACDIEVPPAVVQEAREAAGVMYRLTPQPFGYEQWRDYHRQFRARYGSGAVVPLVDLVADSGLGLPADYQGSAHGRPPRQATERDEKIHTLIQRVLLAGADEIVLTRAVIADLAVGEDADLLPVPRIEIGVEIHSPSVEALSGGAFHLTVTGAPRPGTSMIGRFVHLLPEQVGAALAHTYRGSAPDVLAPQLSFAPRRRRTENIVRTQQLLSHVLPLAEHRSESQNTIDIADLGVRADARQFELVRLSTGRRVEPRVPHSLEASVHTPPLARFLAEIATARCAAYKGFDFGSAVHLPYLPRVRYRRTVLAPARWLITADDLPGRDAAMRAWETALETQRDRLRIPTLVLVVDDDQRLPLDLDHPLHRHMLRRSLNAARQLELREAPSPAAVAWLGRSHELLLPLVLNAPATAPHFSSLPRPTAAGTGHLPGGPAVLASNLGAHPARYNEVLTSHLPDLVGSLPQPTTWWFRRHREMARPDAEQHLALYLLLPGPGAYGPALQQIHDWAAKLRDKRLLAHLSLSTYEPQTGRFGHGDAMDAAHDVFAADSAAALAQILMTENTGIQAQALAAASMVDLAARFAELPEQGLEWLVRHLPQHHGPLDPLLRDQALHLFSLREGPPSAGEFPEWEHVVAAWQLRAAALAAYRDRLADQQEPLSVLRSLLHQHHGRALSVDPADERATDRLVRACARRHTARQEDNR
ncbi:MULTISPECIES: lantibiotic dehydratase [unclassified Streptomyces]|uniref:lantibiotic dehydratase n=1 Tax=Streptomyces sp. NPDC055082 TaxID=3365718 RepID=UPI0037D0E65B